MNRFLLALIACVWLPSAMASPLYHASIPLDNGAQTSQQAAKKQALIAVLTKVSGQREVSDNPAVEQAQQDVDGFISQLGYGESKDQSDGAAQRTLEVGFDSQKIRAVLRQAGLPLWGSPRPAVLVWLVDDRDGDRQIIWEQSGRPVIDQLRDAAAIRGLPVLIPVGDFDDLMAISSSDLWGGFIDPVEQASQRYQPDGIVIGKLTEQGIRWQFFPDTSDMQSDQTRGQANNAQAMIDTIADYYAEQTGVVLDNDDERASLQIAIAGMDNGDDYVDLERTLAGLNALQQVHLAELNDDTLIFDVRLAASQQALINELTANRHIRLMTPQEREARTMAPAEEQDSTMLEDKSETAVSDTDSDKQTTELLFATPALTDSRDADSTDNQRLWFVWTS
ncbi:DUF2066 domain-containing protein [Salinivibrio costicola]|uniref:DUF2066 domain-containing protein n=1 Tax=Salinivibrio costicola subsp. alcaliphilus TaxID=272773 RepID=A0ABX3KUI4_SALCS|nr:DUF2066 domain-containing protein [Salinivibrio costicola]OOF35109.1 hypothetical protein BZJ21_02360 [Salinivibrio costicola subsp. alcaliphilus]